MVDLLFLQPSGNQIPLDNPQGIDILGNLIEASFLSPNPRYYGGIHNDGHNFISLCHDPEGKYNEDIAVMGVCISCYCSESGDN